jgi:hypothetical protein
MAVRLSALRILSAGRPSFTLATFVVPISVRCWVEPRAVVWLYGSDQSNYPVATSGIETTTFWLVAECQRIALSATPELNWLSTAELMAHPNCRLDSTQISTTTTLVNAAAPRYVASSRTAQETQFPTVLPLLHAYVTQRWLRYCCVFMQLLCNNGCCLVDYFAVAAQQRVYVIILSS